MPLARLPITGSDANTWSDILNRNITQTNSALNGAFNSFDLFSQRPTNLSADEAGKTYLYTQTGNWHEWNGIEWRVQNKSEINVKDYGAIGDGTDATNQIQFCIDKAADNKGTVYVPNGRHAISKPLEISSSVTFYGESQRGAVITKNTNTTGISNLNALIILKKDAGGFNSYCVINNMFIGSDIKIDFGIVCEHGSAYLKNPNIETPNYAFNRVNIELR